MHSGHILEFLDSHVSCRHFTGQPITEEQERRIVAIAQRAPTSSNLQAYSIISVRSAETKRRLASLAGDQAHIDQCPLFLVICADLHRLKRLCERRDYMFRGEYAEAGMVAIVDATLAAGRVLLAAQAMGLGGVMVGGIRTRIAEVTELLGLPKFTCPVMGMSLGYPEHLPAVKPRLPLDAVLYQERYNDELLDAAISNYDDTMRETGIYNNREYAPERFPKSASPYSWSEHSARRIANDAPSTLRPHMLSFLRSQGMFQK